MWESTSSQAFATQRFLYVCQLDNSSLFYNVTNEDTCDCDARFQAHPDIAGWGTIAAFAALSMITIIFAAIPAYYDGIVRFRAIRRSWRQRKERNQQARLEPQISAQISARPTRPPLERFETTRSNILARHFTETGSIENYETFQKTKPRLRTAEKVLATLCDVQLFTTTSVLIAAYALGNKLTFYHGGVVTNYYWFAVQSFWASRQHKWWETPEDVLAQQNADAPRPRKPLRHHLREFFIKDEPFRLYIRRFFIFVCTTLFVVLYGISIQDQAVKRDPLTSGKCFRSGDASDGPSDWFWLAGISVYGIVLFLSMFVFTKKAVAALSTLLHESEAGMFAKVGREWKLFRSCAASDPPRFLLRIRRGLWVFILVIASIFWCIFVQGATNWFFGDGIYAVEVLFYIGMWCWAFYDVVDLKTANKMLLIGNEEVWTYGQILTVAMIGIILFSTLDSWEEDVPDEDQRGDSGSDEKI